MGSINEAIIKRLFDLFEKKILFQVSAMPFIIGFLSLFPFYLITEDFSFTAGLVIFLFFFAASALPEIIYRKAKGKCEEFEELKQKDLTNIAAKNSVLNKKHNRSVTENPPIFKGLKKLDINIFIFINMVASFPNFREEKKDRPFYAYPEGPICCLCGESVSVELKFFFSKQLVGYKYSCSCHFRILEDDPVSLYKRAKDRCTLD